MTDGRRFREGTTIVAADDLRVDQILDVDDLSAITITGGRTTLITSSLVSQCH